MMQKLAVKFLQGWPLLIPAGAQVQYYGLLVSVHAIPSANINASRQSLLFVMNILCSSLKVVVRFQDYGQHMGYVIEGSRLATAEHGS